MSAYSAAVLADSPAAYYRLNETSGNFVDVAAAHNATPSGTIVPASSLIPSDPANGAAKFSWSSGTLKQADTSGFNFCQVPMTIEFWVNIASLSVNPAATGFFSTVPASLILGSGNADGFCVGYKTDGNLYWAFNGVAGIPLDYTFTVGVTYHVVIIATVAAASALTIYINAVLPHVAYAINNPIAATTSLCLGSRLVGVNTEPSAALNALDEVALYTSALSAARIAAHYQAGVDTGTLAALGAGS